MSDEPDWEDVRRHYHARALRTSDILAKYGISTYALNKRIKEDGWKKRPSAIAAAKAAMPAAKAVTKVAKSKVASIVAPPAAQRGTAKPLSSIAKRRKILESLHNTIERKLALIEARIGGKGRGVTAADFERDTRSIAHLIKSLEQATEFDHDQRGKRITGAAAKSASVAATALADEADRLRRELAERLQRLVDPTGE